MKRPRTYRERLRCVLHCTLRTISKAAPQVLPDGTVVEVPPEEWKEKYRAFFLGADVSTEDISDSRLRTFILEVESHAAQIFEVSFPTRETT